MGMLRFLSIPLILQVLLIIHVVRNNRSTVWIFVLIFVPVGGGIAYIIVEILPDLLNTRNRRAATAAVTRVIAPDRILKQLEEQAEFSPTVANKKALADEYCARERYREAIDLYNSCLSGPFAGDTETLLALSRAQLESGAYEDASRSLEKVESNGSETTHPAALLLRARILEKQGSADAAEETFRQAAVAGSGLENQYRYISYLKRAGKDNAARTEYEAMVRRFRMMPGFSRKLNRPWMARADREMR